MADVPRIYNLFPRHYKTIDDWCTAIPSAAGMGFNWIFINPFHATGFSGSLYAIKDYYQLNPQFLKRGQDPKDWTPLKDFIAECGRNGIQTIMDLVINHTAIDSVLTKTNKAWYKKDENGDILRPFVVDLDDPGKITVWGDLGEIDNEDSKDKRNLWKYWDSLIAFFQKIGFKGFRCDAAYKVPSQLWAMLIAAARKRDPEVVFFAETLGCKLEEITALKGTGFDYLFNSSKYWNYEKSWCIDQHECNQQVAPSISFPESHDTSRLASEAPGSLDMQKSKYLFCMLFSKGLMMVSGFEYGAKIKTDVVKGSPADVERGPWDLRDWIAGINALKTKMPLLGEEGHWQAITTYDADILFLERTSENRRQRLYMVINKDWYNPRTLRRHEFPQELQGCRYLVLPFDSTEKRAIQEEIPLRPNEIALFM
jgi:starch synthase (maltosyl-transferring)